MAHEQDLVEIRSEGLAVRINPVGAELFAIAAPDGRALLYDGDPAFWSFRAPLLFPVVGMLANGRYRTQGRFYALEKHGFARRRRFRLADRAADRAVLYLEADAETLAVYPFRFRLEAAFHLAGAALTVTARVCNLGAETMPASFGFHPAFPWPLPGGGERLGHTIVFAEDEPAPIRQVGPDGLVRSEALASPVEGRTLRLRDGLFANDALIFDALRSTSLVYAGPEGRGLRISFQGTPLLGLWTKPGAPFLCVEPWSGLADPEGFDGDIFEKPWILALEPSEERSFAMTIEAL
jgi:galactose mutarotase-like enzyme